MFLRVCILSRQMRSRFDMNWFNVNKTMPKSPHCRYTASRRNPLAFIEQSLLSSDSQSVFSRASAVSGMKSPQLSSITAHSLHIAVFEEQIFPAGCRRFRANGVVAATRPCVVTYVAHTRETKPNAYFPGGGVLVNSGVSLEPNEKYMFPS